MNDALSVIGFSRLAEQKAVAEQIGLVGHSQYGSLSCKASVVYSCDDYSGDHTMKRDFVETQLHIMSRILVATFRSCMPSTGCTESNTFDCGVIT